MRGWFIVALALGACGKSKSEGCRTRAHQLSTMLGAIDLSPPVLVDRRIHLVMRPDLPRSPSGSPMVQVSPTDVILQGTLVDAGDGLRERLDAMHARAVAERQQGINRGDRSDVDLIHLAIDQDTPWETVASVTTAANAAGYTHAAFTFGGNPDATSPPPRSSIDGDLDRVFGADEDGGKAQAIGQLGAKVTRTCPALKRAFGSVSEDSGDKAAFVLRSIEPALLECDCSLDVAALGSMMYRVLHTEHPTASLVVTVARDGTPVTLPGATPWRDASKQLGSTGAPIWLAVAPAR